MTAPTVRRALLTGLSAVFVFFLWMCKPALADTPCPPFNLPFPTNHPVTSAGLLCDANGNLDVNVKIGGGGGGSTVLPYTGVAAGAYGQTGVVNSGILALGFNYQNQNNDALTVAPFGGNGSGTGYPASYGQPGVLVVQGGLQGGAIGISGNLGGPYSAATAQPTAASSFMGVGGTDGTSFHPLFVNSAGAVAITGTLQAGAITVLGGTANATPIPVTGPNGSPLPVSGSFSATVSYPYTLPTAVPTPQPMATAGSFIGIGGSDYSSSGNFNGAKVASNGSMFVSTGQSGTGTVTTNGSSNGIIVPVQGATALSITISGTFSPNLTWAGDTGSGTYPITLKAINSAGTVSSSGSTGNTYTIFVGSNSTVSLYTGSTMTGTATVNWSLGNLIATNFIQPNSANSSAGVVLPFVGSAMFAYNGTNVNPIPNDYVSSGTGGPLQVTSGGKTTDILTSGTATTCTAIKTSPGRIAKMFSTGAASTVYPQFYNDNGTCSAGDLVWGDGSSLTFPAGSAPLTLDMYFATAISMKLSGALSINAIVTYY